MVNSKAKGGEYERKICKLFSLWVTDGKRTDVFWRSAMSGGRSTVAHKKGIDIRQAGDICSVSPEGHDFCDRFYVECKHYKDLGLGKFLLEKKGTLARFWQETVVQANRHGRVPMMICKARGPDFVVTNATAFNFMPHHAIRIYGIRVFLLSEMLKLKYA